MSWDMGSASSPSTASCNRFPPRQLSAQLGSPGVFAVREDCAELNVTAAPLQSGFRETFEQYGITERKELHHSLTARPWTATSLDEMVQGQHSLLRSLNELQKTRLRASDHYGTPLKAKTAQSRQVPKQHFVTSETRNRWLKELAGSTPLRHLERCLPQGFLGTQLLRDLCSQQVPLLRASWLIKIVYSNLVRPSGPVVAPIETAQRSSQWTRAFTEYCESQLPTLAQAVQLWASRTPQPALSGSSLVSLLYCALGHGGHLWIYALSVFGQTVREGLANIGNLVAWLTQRMHSKDASGAAATLLLLPLLHLVLQDVTLSQQLTREVMSLCIQQIKTESRGYTSQPVDNMLKKSFWDMLQSLVQPAPHSFVAFDVFQLGAPEGSADALPSILLQAPQRRHSRGEVGRSEVPASLEHLARTIIQRRASLAATVQAKVLGYSEADLMKVIENGLAGQDAATVARKLSSLITPWQRGEGTVREVVRIICQWACSIPTLDIALTHHAIEPERVHLIAESILGSKRVFALSMLDGLAKHKHAAHLRTSVPALQAAVYGWLEHCHSASPTTCLHPRQISALLLQIVGRGFFCPGVYLQTLLAHGLVPAQPSDSKDRAHRAQWHCRMLQQLDPRLHIPSLKDLPSPPTPGGDTETISGWSFHLQHYSNTRAAVLEKWRQQTAGHLWTGKVAESSPDRQRPSKRCKSSESSREKSPALLRGPKASTSLSQETSRDGAASLLRGSRISSLRSGLGSSRGSPSVQHSADTSSPASIASLQDRQLAGLAAVQQAAALSLSFKDAPEDFNATELLLAVANLRCWEQRCFVQWMCGQVRWMDGRPDLLVHLDGEVRVLWWVVALLEAAGGHSEAIDWLLQLLECCTPKSSTGQDASASTPLLLPLCSMLAARQQLLSAASRLPRMLDSCTLWRLHMPAVPAQHPAATQVLSHLALEVLHCFRDNVEVQQWLAAMQQSHGHHPAVQQLSRKLESSRNLQPRYTIQLVQGPLPTEPARRQCSIKVIQAVQVFVASPTPHAQASRLAAAITQWVGGAGDSGMECLHAAVATLVGHPNWGPAGNSNMARGVLQVLLLLRCSVIDTNVGSVLARSIMTACAEQSPDKDAILVTAISAGLVDLEDCCRETLGASERSSDLYLTWLSYLLGPDAFQPAAASPAACGTAVQLGLLQARLPGLFIWEHYHPLFEAALSDGTAASRARLAVDALLGHGPFSRTLLNPATSLQSRLAATTKCTHSSRPGLLPMALLMSALLGRIEECPHGLGAAELQAYLDARANSLLALATPASQLLLAVLLRWHLNEQVMVSAMSAGSTAADALLRAEQAAQDAHSGQARITEEEKTFTSRVLAQLLVQPQAAAVLARLTWALGKGLGEYLLQQVDWVLQDAESLLGHHSLASVLRRRFGTLLGTTPHDKIASSDFALEQGFANVALTCLSCSQPGRHREFAEQLILQLKRLGEVLRQAEGLRQEKPLQIAPLADPRVSTGGGGPEPGPVGSPSMPSAFGAGRARRMAMQAAMTAGPVEGVQVAIWLRLTILPSLLPLVYADRESDAAKNLRALLAPALLNLLTSKSVYTSKEALERIQAHDGKDLQEGQRQASQSLKAAEQGAGVPLFDRLLELLHALLAGSWASWLRGDKAKLREVPTFDSRSLQQELQAASVPSTIKSAIQSALTTLPSPGASALGHAVQDPWALPDWEAEEEALCGIVPACTENTRMHPAMLGAILQPRN